MGPVRRALPRRLAVAGTAAATAFAVLASPAAAAEGTVLGTDNPAAIPNSYIVVFKDAAVTSVDTATSDLARKYGASVEHTYRHAVRGFAGRLSAKAARQLAADPSVAYVEQNGVVGVADTQPNPPSWGLDRIDQRDLPLDNSYTYPNTASNVTAYIIDTGIRTTHADFGGRATWGTNTVDSNNTDCNGHGTHVAGTVGGTAHGVAKGVRLVAVKVLNCQGSGTLAGVTAGVDWVTNNATRPAVANMSLGASGTNTTLENAVRNSIASGVTYALASGNSNADACNFTPARTPEAITVNASTRTDARASFSNYGTCTDIFAPGQDITAPWNTSDTATNTISGTSMAAPHVAGGAALILGASPSLTPAQVASAMISASTPNKITNPGSGSPNRLLYVATGQPSGPSITNPGTQQDVVGSPASLQLAASGGSTPYTWSATGLPTGLSVNASTGLISGTPTVADSYSVTATVTDSAGRSASTTFTWIIEKEDGGGGDCASPGQKLVNPGFESGTTGWSNATWTIYSWTGTGAPRSGTRSSWISGYGYTETETLQQTVTIPAGCTESTLSLYLKIVSSESGSTVYDTFTVKIGSTTLATYSNVDESGYTLRSFDVGAYAGQTVTISFTGSEDWSLQTSFVLDDLALTAG
ncbi:S8 family peptidase [Actinokineospora sp. UTMC 2448]|uniref:S8 family peptidase n=1 Tax=Actinokineospora sp. UTMC 2448 TaxID=2268449 RepID=UPI0022047CD9|nr:Aqualysin-1 precursor [Actinokineospora sp. UTMC 2448]